MTQGISLIETLLASAIFILSVATLGLMGFSGVDLAVTGSERTEMLLYAEEGIEAARAIRSQDFADLVPGLHGFATTSGGWVLAGTENKKNGWIRRAEVTSLGLGRTRLDVYVSKEGQATTSGVALTTYLHDLFGSSWIQTTLADFLSGKDNGTEALGSVGDGAVGLRIVGDWAQAKLLVSGNIPGATTVRTLTEKSGLLFAGSDVNGEELAIFDLADVSSGVLPKLRTTNVGAQVNSVAVSGNYAYLATGSNSRELVVVRIADGAIVNQLNLSGTADGLSVAATGTMLYLGRASSGQAELYEISILNPLGALSASRSLQIADDVNGLLVDPSGNLLGASANDSGEVFAVNRTTFAVGSTLNLPGNADARALAVSGATLYATRLSSGDQELVMIDASDPLTAMNVTDGIQLAGSAYAVSVGGDGMIAVATGIASGEVGLFLPGPLRSVGTFNVNTSSGARAVLIRGAHIYAGMNNADPEIVVLSGGSGAWEAPGISGGYDAQGNPDGQAVWSDGTRAYLGTANQSSGGEFYILNVSDPMNPTFLSTLNIGAAVNDVVILGTHVYLATAQTSRELTVVNIANPAAPSIVGSYNVTGNIPATTLIASGTIIYLGTQNNSAGSGRELYAIDVSVPTLPVLRGTLEIGANVNDVALGNGFVLLGTASNAKELIVVNGTPTAMGEIASYDTPSGADALAVAWADTAGGFLALGTQNNGGGSDYYQFTLAPNGTPLLQSFLDLAEDNNDIALLGGIAFVANDQGGGGLRTLNAENPGAPLVLGGVSLGGIGRSVFALPTTVYVANSLNTREFAVIRPTPAPTARARESWFTSSAFDAGSDVSWQTLTWTTSGTGTVKFQLRTAGDFSGLSQASWVGPDGTSGTFYTISGGAIMTDPGASGTRWIEYRFTLEGDGLFTPFLEEVRLAHN